MNQTRLENAQRWFLSRYPGGFAHPELALIGKKHRLEKMQDFVRDNFAQKKFRDTDELLADWVKLVSRASLVSIFEKPKFRDLVNDLSPKEKNGFAAGLKAQLHGDQQTGFEKILHLLQSYKFAKWSIISLAPIKRSIKASSMIASASIITAALPPNSSVTFLRPALAFISQPT